MLMDDSQIPPVQPTQKREPVMIQQVVAPDKKQDASNLTKTIVLIVEALVAVTFIGLFIWIYSEYNAVRTDVEGQITKAVAEARIQQADKDEAEFAEREKYPYKTFSGPEDYGELSFEYPKTWSVFVAADASKGGDFIAYLNPGQINPVTNDMINALRVTIRDASFESVVSEYQNIMSRNSDLTVESITVNGGTANRYSGTIPGTDLKGIIVVLKIRDKTAILSTDSLLFKSDFEKVIDSIKFNA